MKRRKNNSRVVGQSIAMVMQFGLNMIVPIGMMSALGIWLDRKLGTSFLTIVLFAVGAVAGGQNIYRLAKGICREQDGSGINSDAFPASETGAEGIKMSREAVNDNGKQEEGALKDGGDN